MIGKARQPHALPTPTATRSVKRTGAGVDKETGEQVAHAGESRMAGVKQAIGNVLEWPIVKGDTDLIASRRACGVTTMTL